MPEKTLRFPLNMLRGLKKKFENSKTVFMLLGIEPRFFGPPARSVVAIPAGLSGFCAQKGEGLELSADVAFRVNLKPTTGLGMVTYSTNKQNCGCLSFLLFFIGIVVTDLFSESHCLQ
jgi:hypothetical protein